MKDCPTVTEYAYLYLPQSKSLIVSAFVGILIPFIFTTNSTLLAAIIHTKQYKNSTYCLFLVLCISDCLLSVVPMPLTIVALISNDCHLRIATTVLLSVNSRVSCYMIFVIAIDRYCRTNTNLQRRSCCSRFLTTKAGSITLIATWVVIALTHGLFHISSHFRTAQLPLHLIDIAGMSGIFILYTRLYLRVKTAAVVRASGFRRRKPRHVRRLGNTVLLILLTFGACFLPFIVVKSFNFIYQDASIQMMFVYHLSIELTWLSGAINALVVIFRNQALKTYCIERLCHYSKETRVISVTDNFETQSIVRVASSTLCLQSIFVIDNR